MYFSLPSLLLVNAIALTLRRVPQPRGRPVHVLLRAPDGHTRAAAAGRAAAGAAQRHRPHAVGTYDIAGCSTLTY